MIDGNRLVVIGGCSGGGKSTLAAALAERGFAVVREPGRRLLAQGVAPWDDPVGFVRKALETAVADHDAATRQPGWVFFDRGVVDAASALQHLTGEPALQTYGDTYRYHPRVFLAPPWPEIYVQDEERRHGFDRAVAEYERLVRDFPALGYTTTELPRVSVEERAAFVVDMLG